MVLLLLFFLLVVLLLRGLEYVNSTASLLSWIPNFVTPFIISTSVSGPLLQLLSSSHLRLPFERRFRVVYSFPSSPYLLLHSSSFLLPPSCILPSGTGLDQPIIVRQRQTFFSRAAPLVSYALPTITNITGCEGEREKRRDVC